MNITDDVTGGDGLNSGAVEATNGKLASISIGGDVAGSSGMGSGWVFSLLNMGAGKNRGGPAGGQRRRFGQVTTGTGKIASVTIGGSILGGGDFGRSHIQRRRPGCREDRKGCGGWELQRHVES